MSTLDEIYTDVLRLEPTEKLRLIEKILASLHPSNMGVETLWGNEAEERIESHAQKNIKAIDATTVLSKYDS